ncbi:OsmC family protein [Mesorhizobium sp. BR1-1-16]|uniref:OsmC family protein n=1 Tax=Mesorhizobium sp. BR1-1-16 TaxID=2876653 RepID=UPI001CC92C90|nr:OsmC family protein [Mesorhizobium sp. BR1-1-16]MBZ9938335.1 OsmC family protein [Mesorhizobium sp. BR1-1-16]
MAQARVKTRQAGAEAALARAGRVALTTDTGGTLAVTTHATEAGFSPLDLLHSALAACLALSARIAASQLGVLDRLEHVRVHVSGEKAEDGPGRIARFLVRFEIEGDLDAATREAIIAAAEGDICTVSNTLRGAPEIILTK